MSRETVEFCWRYGFWTAYCGALGVCITLWGWLAFWGGVCALGALLVAFGCFLERRRNR